MSYKTLRIALRELSLEQLQRMRRQLWHAQQTTRSPARKVKIAGQLQIIGAAIDRAYELIERDDAYETSCA